MTLEEMAQEYRDAARAIYQRVRRERAELENCPDGCRERRERLGRIRIMLGMYRDLRQTAVHIEKYYDRSRRKDERYSI